VNYAEGLLVGYRHFDKEHIVPEFPFGHGLSYTTFAFRDLAVINPSSNGQVGLTVAVKNTGNRRGAEVVQVYVHDSNPALPRPDQELKAFGKVDLAPGEEKVVHLDLDQRSFAYYDPAKHDWVNARGTFEIRVGSSSRDIRLKSPITIAPATR
jgi:beta-glucosidase